MISEFTPKPKKSGAGILLPFFLFFILMCSTALAWDSYSNDNQNIGAEDTYSAEFDSTKVFTSIPDGANFQPLLVDVDNDSRMDVIGSDGDYLKIWELSGGVLVLKDELDFGATQTAMFDVIPSYDSDDYTDIISVFGTNVSIWEYTGSAFEITKSYTAIVRTAPICVNTTHSQQIACFWGDNDGNMTSILWNGTAWEDMESWGTYNGTDVFTTNNGLKETAPIYDIDRDGADEIVYICDYNNDGQEGICVVDISSLSAFDTYFSTDGVIDNLAPNSKPHAPVIYNLDGAGDSEIIVTYNETTGQDGYLVVYKANGDDYISAFKVLDSGSADRVYISNPVVSDSVNDIFDDNEDICVFVIGEDVGYSNDRYGIKCYDDEGDQTFEYVSGYSANNDLIFYAKGGTIATANVLDNSAESGGRDTYEIIVGGAMLSLDAVNIPDAIQPLLNISVASSTESSSNVAVGDLNSDYSADICGMRAGNVYCTYMSVDNEPPELSEIQINTGNPVCVGETIIFSAVENTDYTNDHSYDTERIIVKFNSNSSQYSGAYSSTNPTLSFEVPATTGSYSLTIYLEDLINAGDTSQYSEYTLTTSNSTAVCNEAGESSTSSTQTSSAGSVSGDDLGGWFEGILESFGISASSAGSTFLWLVVMFGVALGMVKTGIRTFIPHVVVQIPLLIMGALIGFVSGWVIFVVGFLSAGISVLYLFGAGKGGN